MSEHVDFNYYPTYQFAIPLPHGMTVEEFNRWWNSRTPRERIRQRIGRYLQQSVQRREENSDRMWERLNV